MLSVLDIISRIRTIAVFVVRDTLISLKQQTVCLWHFLLQDFSFEPRWFINYRRQTKLMYILRARSSFLITQSPKNYRFISVQLTYFYKTEDLADKGKALYMLNHRCNLANNNGGGQQIDHGHYELYEAVI